MALPKINPTTTASWKNLQQHFKSIQSTHLKTLFAQEPNRAEDFTIKWEDFYVDFSKNRINKETVDLLLQLANEVKLKEAIGAYFSGEIINETENRAVLHTALRVPESAKVVVDGVNVVPEVYKVKNHIKTFSESV